MSSKLHVRPCGADEAATLLAIVNAAAQAYRGVIPADRWHEPYMSADVLLGEIDAGVAFFACEEDGVVVGVMGIQPSRNVRLIRHAYVSPSHQGRGVGAALMRHLRDGTSCPLLVGTWAAATWAIRFYERHGFALVPGSAKARLLRAYWSLPERQVETSVVLAAPPLSSAEADKLLAP